MGASFSSQGVAPNPQRRLETKDLPSLRLLGKGLSGFVYETTWQRKKYARKDFPVGSRKREIFENEASVLLKLEHPNIVKCIDYTLGKSSCSLLLEYVDADLQNDMQRRMETQRKKNSTGSKSTLRDIDEIKRLLSEKVKKGDITRVDEGSSRVPQNGIPLPYDIHEAAGLIFQIATAMKYLHDNRIVHGDLKPNNILVCSESGKMIVKVADFGLVETKKQIKLVSKRARHFEILTWKAPELFSKLLGPVTEDSDDPFTDSDTDLDEDIRSSDDFFRSRLAMADVYSFGLLCSYILGGQLFFPGLSLTQLRKQRLDGRWHGLPPTCPEVIKDLIYSSLKSDPQTRPTFSDICTHKALLPPFALLKDMIIDSMSGSRPKPPIKILLCGRTGSGKSSVANMLVKGDLNPPLLFPTSSGVRGMTISCQREESKDFVVVDTVGLGEAQHGSVMDDEARNMLYDFFVKISQESYNYFAYVHKWGKLDHLDGELWAFFQKAFVGAERNFVIILTHCSPKALEENLEGPEGIKVAFEGCERYITVDFPAASKPEASSSVRTRRNDKLRTDSLVHLQESLAISVPDLTSNPCLRSNLKKGRILLMGSNARARNLIAEMLVNGTKNLSTSSASSCHGSNLSGVGFDRQPKSALFEELEGRRWQVVNASVFDKERIGDIYTDVGSEEEAIQVASSAVTMLAWEFLTILRHGTYSHFIYVEDYGEKPPEWKPVLAEITKVLSIWGWVRRGVAVLVNPNSSNISSENSNRFTEWGRECQVLLPMGCESLDVESKNEVIRQLRLDLGIIEEALDAVVPYGAWGSSMSNESGLRVNPNAFEALVRTFRGLEKFSKTTMFGNWKLEQQDDCVDTSSSYCTVA